VTVVFYISGHGFGHASRQVEVINALAARRPDVRIAVRSSVSPALLARTIRTQSTLDPVTCDSGIVQVSSIEHDDAATLRHAIDFYRSFEGRVRAEVGALTHSNARVIVGDIPPLAFAVAARLELPSLAIANFTWDWIYESHPGFDTEPWILPLMREAYSQASYALALPFSGGFEVFPARESLPLIARHAQRSREETRAHFGIPQNRRVALLSFGGYGLPSLDLSAIDCAREWVIVTTDRVTGDAAPMPHVVRLIEDGLFTGGFRYEDLVAASDMVVTKPGYGIIAECASTGTPMLYTSRGDFREYDLMVAEMPSYVRAQFISRDDLFAGRWSAAIEALDQIPAPPPARTDGAEIAAERILEMF
jgi:L-arabinokinase